MIPDYLRRTYWWAYIHPAALRFWDKWLPLNLVLFGNYGRLRDMVLGVIPADAKVIMLGSCYGDLIPRLNSHCKELTVVDCLPQQLELALSKCPCNTILSDAAISELPSSSFNVALIFFLLHEMPDEWRKKVLTEAYRLSGKEGKVLIVDFSMPFFWNLFGYIERIIFWFFEPYAKQFLSWYWEPKAEEKYFGGLYRLISTNIYSAVKSKHPDVSCAAVNAAVRIVTENVDSRKNEIFATQQEVGLNEKSDLSTIV